jgi:hypothetical protein
MMRNSFGGIILCLLVLQLAAAGKVLADEPIEGRMVKASPGMSKAEILNVLGYPDAILRKSIDEQGKVVEVFQYDVIKEPGVSSAEGAGQSLGGFTTAVLTLGMSETMKARNRPYEEASRQQNLNVQRVNNPPYLLVFRDNILQKIERAVMVPQKQVVSGR